MWGWDDRPGAVNWRLSQHDEATPNTAKIIPLRPWFDQPSSRAEESPVIFADESAAQAKVRNAEPLVKPALREQARTPHEEVKTEARTESKTEAKTPAPGSTVVIEQTTPAPPLRPGGDKDGGGSAVAGGGGGGSSPPMHKRSSDNEFRDVLGKRSGERPPQPGDRRDFSRSRSTCWCSRSRSTCSTCPIAC